MTTSIALVDDDPLVRLALQNLLSRVPEVLVVGETGDSGSALRMLHECPADVVLLDIQLQRVSGFAVLPAIRSRFPQTRIVMMTSFNAERYEPHAQMAGADGFFAKSASLNEIIDVILGRQHQVQRRSIHVRMSPRERDVGEMIAQGRSNEQIAVALEVSVNTVKTYVSRLFVKFGVINRVQLSNAINGVQHNSPENEFGQQKSL